MSETIKPDYTYVWSSGGAIVAPSNTKIQTGWTAEVPPFQWENWSQNRQDQAISHILQKGISVWSATGEYYFTTSGERSYVQGSDGNIYVALQDSVNQNPVTDTTFVYWAKALSGGLLATRVFTTSGTYTPTPGTRAILVSVQAGGGGGGSADATGAGVGSAGAGGGAGGFSQSFLTSAFSGVSYVVGAGGTANAAGGASSFAGALSTSGGGGGGTINATSSFPVQIAPPSGGTASGGNLFNSKGSAGGAALLTIFGNGISGFGGRSQFSGGGSPRSGTVAAGDVGLYGAGGSGAITQNNPGGGAIGGSGGSGIIIVQEYM